MTTKISVCIVTRHRHDALRTCLGDLRDQINPPSWELLLAADDDPATETAATQIIADGLVLHSTGLTLGANRNQLADKANGALTLYLDDDVRLPPTLLRDLFDVASQYPEVDVFGGPNLTPTGATRFEQIQGQLLATPWLTGPISKRYRPLNKPVATTGEGLTLCNLAIRTRTNTRFPTNQRGGEENTLLTGLAMQQRAMLRHPAMTVAHERRPTLRSFATQMYKYGYGRGEHLAATLPRARTPRTPPLKANRTGPGAGLTHGATEHRPSNGLGVEFRRHDIPAAASQTATMVLAYVLGVAHALVLGALQLQRAQPPHLCRCPPSQGCRADVAPPAAKRRRRVKAPV